MKKINSVFLILIFLLTACSSLPAEAQSTDQPVPMDVFATKTSSPTPIPATPTPTQNQTPAQVLKFWHPWTGNRGDSIAELVEEFNRSNSAGITIEAVSIADQDHLVEMVESAIDRGDLPDILAAPADFLQSLYKDEGILVGLNDFLSDVNEGISADELKLFPTSFWNQGIVGEERYAVPAEYNFHLLFYNQTWAQELGFNATPTTSEEFLNQACAAARFNASDADDDNNGTGGWIYNTDPLTMLSWMQVFGGGDLPGESSRSSELNTEENRNALEFLQTIYQLDCAWTGKENTPYRYFAKRYAIFYSGTIEDWYKQTVMDSVEGNTDEWTVIAYPGQNGTPIVNSENLSYAIVRSDAGKESAAWSFIRWMLSEDQQLALTEKTYSVPVTLGVAQQLADFLEKNPEWQKVLQYIPLAKPTPLINDWNVIGSLLEDVGWQLSLYYVKAADIPAILDNLDFMANEVLDAN